MAKPLTPQFKDYLFEFSRGVNSGIAPLLLPKNQLAFAINATVRRAYVTHRPAFRKIALDFGGSDALQVAVEKTLWQGACYYKPDSGAEFLVAAIGGGLFKFTPDVNTATVVDIGIPGDPNPATITQEWLWQAENYVIDQNGQNKPRFFDGTTTRRSNSDQIVLGVTAAPFVIPAIGGTVIITLAAPFLGQIGDSFFINGVTYQATYPAAAPNATVTTLLDSAASHAIGEQVVVNPNVLGVQAVTANIPVAGQTFGPNATGFILTLTQPYTGADGILVNFLGALWKIFSHSGVSVFIKNQNTFTWPATVPAGTKVFFNGTSYPISVLGTLVAAFAVPPTGTPVDIQMSVAYTGANGQTVFIGNGQYTIDQKAPPPPGLNLTAININGTPGTNVVDPKNLLSVPELPPGRMGAYGLGRNWMALTDGFSFIASDIVGGSSGTVQNRFRDAVLKTTENTYLAGGGVFRVPGPTGAIQAFVFTATLDTSLGQGPLQVFTPYVVFSCNAPVERSVWQTITNPILTQSLISNGGLGQYSTILANGDTLFRAIDGIRSLILARREFDTWGNTPISQEMERVISLDATALLNFSSAVVFQNRFLITSKPTPSGQGVFNPGTIALNFDAISGLTGKLPSVYDGLWLGVNVLQWVVGRFNGVERAFAFSYNNTLAKIELYELLKDGAAHQDNDGVALRDITWTIESPALFSKVKGKDPDDLCRLEEGRFFVADVIGTVRYQVFYRPQFNPCWIPWIEGTVCANTNGQKQNKAPIGLGAPSSEACDPSNNRPYRISESFQVKFVFTGSCRFYGARFWASHFDESEYLAPKCNVECPELDCTPDDDYSVYSLQDLFHPPPDGLFLNRQVTFMRTCPEGQSAAFTGSLPPWVSFDSGSGLLIGQAGVFTAGTQAAADEKAQNAINEIGNAAIAAGSLICQTPSSICTDGIGALLNNAYQIDGYSDGLITNVHGGVIGARPLWDGTFLGHNATIGSSGLGGWCAGDADFYGMDGKSMCNCTIEFDDCVAGVPQWKLIHDVSLGDNWTGTKVGGNTPEGVYTKVSGDSVGPATITISFKTGGSTLVAPVGCVS